MHFNIPLLVKGQRNSYNKKYRTLGYQIISLVSWIIIIPFKILDLIWFYYLIDLIRGWLIPKRKLTEFEMSEATKVFGNSIDLNSVKIVENSWMAKLGAKSAGKDHIGFVLFRTINFTRPLDHSSGLLDMGWLIHELVHVAQFQQLGVQYILEALRAQKNGGYAYGGLAQLQKSKRYSEFNLEQQADIARDFYKAVITKSANENVLRRFIEDLRKGKF